MICYSYLAIVFIQRWKEETLLMGEGNEGGEATENLRSLKTKQQKKEPNSYSK